MWSGEHPLIWKDTELRFGIDKSLFIPALKTLVLADVHLGKAAHFRKEGIPVPQNLLFENLGRIETALSLSGAKTLLFVGDLFHSDLNYEWTYFEKFRAHFAGVDFVLTRGNHDILDEEHYVRAGVELTESCALGTDIEVLHDMPGEGDPEVLYICGHMHPSVRLRGRGRQSLALPCFRWRENKLLMPAFGAFTGRYSEKPQAGDRYFVPVADKIVFFAAS
ncbi:MAG: ligase-associated DNA damage response endonuclease PdeM [Flavobacteriales bacterium]